MNDKAGNRLSRKLLLCGFVIGWLMSLTACQSDVLSDDPNLRISFSHDSLLFDTVFTNMGSSTKRIMVYNPNKNAVQIKQVSMHDGRYFHINLDGESQLDNLRDITLRGGDSLFLFVRVHINPQQQNSPVLIEDSIAFLVNDHLQYVYLQAYGQDVKVLQSANKLLIFDQLVLTNEKPYVIYDTLVVQGLLSLQKGTTIYMHTGACIYAYGSVNATATLEEPILICGDRTDRLFDSVPYRVVSGQWSGLYLIHQEGWEKPTYQFDYVDIISGTIGLYAVSESKDVRPTLSLQNSRIHNHSTYGLVLHNVDAVVANTEISNCASYCVYLSGGKHCFVHNTIASYFGYPYTTINIHNNILRDDVAAVYINNLSKNMALTESSFYNCIITGARQNNIVVATPLPDYYTGSFVGNFMRTDSLPEVFAHNNVYATDSDSVVFRNIYYKLNEYRYYDYRLDSLSAARGVGDSVVAISYPYDRLGQRRKSRPDAGCYEYVQ